MSERCRGNRVFENRKDCARDKAIGEGSLRIRKDDGPANRALRKSLVISAAFLAMEEQSTGKRETVRDDTNETTHHGSRATEAVLREFRTPATRQRHRLPPRSNLRLEMVPRRGESATGTATLHRIRLRTPERQHDAPRNRRESACSGTPLRASRSFAVESPENAGPCRISRLPCLRDATTLSLRSCERTGFAVLNCP